MADETISTKIVASADFSSLISDVHRVTASLSKLQEQLANSNKMMANQIAVMNRSFADTLRSTGQFSTHFVSLQSDVEKFGKNLDGGKLKLNQYFNAFRDQTKKSGGLIRDLAKQQVALQNSVLQPLGRNAQGLMQFNVHVPRGLDVIKNKTAIARQELAIMNRVIQDGATGLINWGKNTQWAGRQLTVGLTVPLVAFGAAASKAFREADQELVRLTKVYGDVAGSSAQELGRVRDDVSKTAREISAAMGVSFKETIGLAADIAATGKTGDELLGSIRETTRLAVLGEVDRQEAMKATLAIQSAFKQNTEELTKSINFLNAVENQTSTTLNDLVEAIPKAGPVIKGLGGSVQDLALYLTAMREGGINAAEGANALKSALASLINPTDVAVGKFKGLGIDLLGIVNDNAGDLTGTLMKLQGALDTLNPLQKQQAIEQLFGKFQFARLNALFENLGKEGSQTLQVLDLMKASTSELASVADRELAAVTESASGKYRRAIESLRASLAEVGEQFLKINTVLITVIDKVVQFANNLPGPVKQVLALAGGFTAVIGPVIMLSGVLANFFGYMLKGIFHMKSFFKGGEGWKYLTPEMLAAEKAGKLVEQTFYNDAKAAAVLQQALRNLLDEFAMLEQKAKSGAMSVNPAVSTMAGNLVMSTGGQRVVDPNHPMLANNKYKVNQRDSSHMVSRVGRDPSTQTMFGMVPGAHPVNQAIGQSPQIYMNDRLPNFPGLTTINGVSTGIVASEAAKHHAMMATLGMQSKAEIESLKKTIVATGTVNKEFMMTFDDILPIVSKLTDNAARESALIVAELRAGKITVEAAKAKIIALNLQTEQMISSSMQAAATGMGRTLNPTMVPTLNQPVVDASGKSNMRELFKKGKTKDFINKIAGTLGVRTGGAGYNIETTIPKKFEMGGQVIGGPRSDTTDTQYAVLQEGGFVLNRKASDNLLGMNKGGQVPAMVTPGEIYFPNPNKEETEMLEAYNNRFAMGGRITATKNNYGVIPLTQLQKLLPAFRGKLPFYKAKSTAGTYIGDVVDPKIVNKYGSKEQIKQGKITKESINGLMTDGSVPGPLLKSSIKTGQLQSGLLGSGDQFLLGLYRSGIISKQQYKFLARQIKKKYFKYLDRSSSVGDSSNDYYNIVNRVLNDSVIDKRGIDLWQKFSKRPGAITSESMRSSGRQTSRSTNSSKIIIDGVDFGALKGSGGSFFAHAQSPQPYLDELSRTASPAPMTGAFNSQVRGIHPNIYSMPSHGRSAYLGMPLSRMGSSWSNPNYIGGKVNDREYQRVNRGGIIQSYALGGRVRSGVPNYGKKDNSGKNSAGMGGMGMSMAGSALWMGGSSIGGGAGSMMSSLGMAMTFIPMMGMLPKFTSSTNLLKVAMFGVGGAIKAAAIAMKTFIASNPILLGIVISVAAIVQGLKLWRKNAEETKKEQMALYGLSKESAKELGIQNTSLSDQMKSLREEQDLAAAKQKSYLDSFSSSGVQGLTLTIQKLRELKERVKTDMPETIKTLDSLDTSKVNEWAINLKAQMIASGKTVEETTNLIYALIESSNKAGQGVKAIGDKMFSGMTDQAGAVGFILQNLEKNLVNVSKIDASAFASNVDSAINSLESQVKSLTGTKNANGEIITETEAIAIQYKQITDSGMKNKEIGMDALKVLQSQRPEFASILRSTDTIGGMIAKWRLNASGYLGDLQKLNSEQAEMLAAFAQGMEDAATAALDVNGKVDGLKTAAGVIKKLTDLNTAAGKAATRAAKAVESYDKKKIEGYKKELKSIKDIADAKRKALDDNFNKENAELEMQKARLELQQAVAKGDMDGIAAAQIRIEQMEKEMGLATAKEKINANEKKESEAIESKIEAEEKKRDAAEEGAANAKKKQENTQANLDRVSSIGKEITTVATLKETADMPGSTAAQKEAYTKAARAVLNRIAVEAVTNERVKEAYVDFLKGGKDAKIVKGADGVKKYETEDLNKIDYVPGYGVQSVSGKADELFDKLGNSMSSFAIQIMGKNGKSATLFDIAQAIKLSKDTAVSVTKDYGNINYNKFDPRTWANTDNINNLIKNEGLSKGSEFKYKGKTYKVDSTYGPMDAISEIKRAGGGRVVPGIPYTLNDGGKVEGIKFDMPATVYPNVATMPRYDIASGFKTNPRSFQNVSNNNSVYNFDIELNGTNITTDDMMRAIGDKMKRVGATLGRPITVKGGDARGNISA